MPRDARPSWFAVACIAATFASCQPSHGAEFDVNLERSSCEIRVSGYIEQGDLAKFKSALPKGYVVGKAGPTMCLNSPGGDFVEGLDIAQYVADGFSTYLEQGATCGSACSWIFMAGTNQSTGGSSLSRAMHVGSNLVFHAPYLDSSAFHNNPAMQQQSASLDDVIKAYNQAISEVGKGVLKLASRRTSFDLLPLIDSSLVTEALINTNEFRVDTLGKAVRWNIGVEGAVGLPPKSKDDVITACRNGLALADDFWDWDFLYSTKSMEYLAFYDPKERMLTAQIVLESIASGACEVRIKFTDDLKEIDSIEVDANLPWELSVGRQWIKGTRGPISVALPSYAAANPTSPLTSLARAPGAAIDPRSLTTVSRPDWCVQQVQKQPDEKTICSSARLAAFDVLLDRYYRDSVAKATREGKTTLQSEQRQWLAKRQACDTDEDCLDRVYHSQIQAVREHD
jgi:uncharacterized protein